jgi:F-type H+-transporting ATPase subunit alpha
VTKGFLDNKEVSQVKEWEKGLHDHLKSRYGALVDKFEQGAKLEAVEAELRKAIEEYDKGLR